MNQTECLKVVAELEPELSACIRLLVPGLHRFWRGTDGKFIGYSARALDESTHEPLPHHERQRKEDRDKSDPTDDRKPPLPRCPTITSQLLLLAIETDTINLWDIAGAASKLCTGAPLHAPSSPGIPATIDHLAIRLLLLDDDLRTINPTESLDTPLQSAIERLAGPNGPKYSLENLSTWRKQLLESSLNNGDSPCSDLVTWSSVVPALASWHAQRGGISKSISIDIKKRLDDPVLIATQPVLIGLASWLATSYATTYRDWKNSPQGVAYTAIIATACKRLATSLKLNIANSGEVDFYTDLADATSAKRAWDIGELADAVADRVKEWHDSMSQEIAKESKVYCTSFLDSKSHFHNDVGSACYAYFAWTLMSPVDARSSQSKGDDVLKRMRKLIDEFILKPRDVWGGAVTRLSKAAHNKPTPEELALVYLFLVTSPGLTSSRLSNQDVERYIHAAKLGVQHIKALFSESSRYSMKLPSREDPTHYAYITFGPEAQGLGGCSAWETYLTTRLAILNIRVCSAIRREMILQQYSASEPPRFRDIRNVEKAVWLRKVADADPHTSFSTNIYSGFVRPIVVQAIARRYFINPGVRGCSFILYGPPGSGKTYAVEALSEVLGWPLISLNPSHFIAGGENSIESNARRIFEDLQLIDRSVILFDECDELFRSRRVTDEASRNVLSFATAAMLPKLHDLRKKRNVIFVLATNYLSNIDDAVRREGRFDARLFVDRPHTAERYRYIDARIARQEVFVSLSKLSASPVAAADLRERVERVRALAGLLLLRRSDGYSITQTWDLVDRVMPKLLAGADSAIVASSSDLLLWLNAVIRSICFGGALASDIGRLSGLSGGSQTYRFASAGPECLLESWPVLDEREIAKSNGMIRHGVGDGRDVFDIVLDDLHVNAFDIHASRPCPAYDPIIGDYLEWIALRSQRELECGALSGPVVQLLQMRWRSIAGFVDFLVRSR